MLINEKQFFQLGLLNEAILRLFEDVEWNRVLRFRKHGFEIAFKPQKPSSTMKQGILRKRNMRKAR